MYLRICVSAKPNLAFSHGQNVTVEASPIRIGLPFMSAIDFTSSRGCVISTCGSFWNTAITALTFDALAHEIERDEAVRAHAEIGGAAGEDLRHIDCRPALTDRHVQSALGVEPFRQRLIEAAVLGLRLPVGDEDDPGLCFALRRRVGRVLTATGNERHEHAENRAPGSRPIRSCDQRPSLRRFDGAGADAEKQAERGLSSGSADRK